MTAKRHHRANPGVRSCLLPGQKARPDTKKLMVVGAHPDDCESAAGGLAAVCARRGWQVRFVSVTSGDAGHHEMKPKPLAALRLKEARKAASRIGASYVNLGEPDGRLFVTDSTTRKVVTAIRKFAPDVLVCPRICDYHRDHRNTGQLVLDASFVLQVPLVYREAPAMDRVPLILYTCDWFTEGPPFKPDVLVDVSRVEMDRVRMLLDHESQLLEWLPWLAGRKEVGRKNPVRDRKAVAERVLGRPRAIAKRFARELRKKYGRKVRAAEAYQVSEYGRRPAGQELKKLLPF